ncbi:hypothetical protein [Nocardia wallacei]|uniref:hypothetical protein n=1 Tax=Nocardia wallacei TaxID=480035 RepID=UPI002457D7B7|nr:hypothetical protein [Nocardia wallacei]
MMDRVVECPDAVVGVAEPGMSAGELTQRHRALRVCQFRRRTQRRASKVYRSVAVVGVGGETALSRTDIRQQVMVASLLSETRGARCPSGGVGEVSGILMQPAEVSSKRAFTPLSSARVPACPVR